MRSRSNSGIRLDYFQRLVNRCILRYQVPGTGLISCSESNSHCWVRDNVYSIMSVWGLALAYRKTADLDEDRAKSYELEKSVVMLMRGLLRCMMMQVDKLEKFKSSQSPRDALHAKYCSKTGKAVVGDYEWGHLQIDATSLYLLTLAQMTASGLQIIFTLDEVAFIQNLVFYIETAYRTPDYGIWERGDKTNHGLPELNSSSIGMAKAALEAINELDLFGARGGPSSVVHVLPDEAQQCKAILMSMLPRESSSKEVDASLLTIIGFPAFAVDDPEVIKETHSVIKEKLMGKYGCSRFLRDGYKTAKEDSSRLHYEPGELLKFEKIECQWPLFFAYYILDGLFHNDKNQIEEYRSRLDEVLLRLDDGIPCLPELYSVPAELVDKEYANPNSQRRIPDGKVPHMWGQSMYILGRLMHEGYLSPGELDPLNRRLVSEPKPDVVVQVVILAETRKIADILLQQGIKVQTPLEISPIQVHPARVLSQIYSFLGKNKRMGLSGRPSGEIGLLATSKLYMLDDRIFAFIPQFIDQHHFYLPLDLNFILDHFTTDTDYLAHSWNMLGRPTIIFQFMDLQSFYVVLDTTFLVDFFRTEVAYLKSSWKALGRPTMIFLVSETSLARVTAKMEDLTKPKTLDRLRLQNAAQMLQSCERSSNHTEHAPVPLIATIKKLQSGYISGTRVHMGNLSDFLTTSCITQLSFLRNQDDPSQKEDQVLSFIDKIMSPASRRPYLLTSAHHRDRVKKSLAGKAVTGIVRRSCSIQIDPEQIPELHAQLAMRRQSRVAINNPSTASNTGLHEAMRKMKSRKTSICETEAPSPYEIARSKAESGSDSSLPSSPQPSTDAEELTYNDSLHLKLSSSGHFDLPHTPAISPCPSPTLGQMPATEKVNIEELLGQLKASESLQEQADIIHYLYKHKGLHWDTGIDKRKRCTVHDLLMELYEKAGHWKQWWLVRHTAGMLQKRVEDLAIAATDLLVRQKQLSVGLPPDCEHIITCPLPPDELATIIFEACGDDCSTASLTQELLIYLAMFIRTEPKLFHEMLRLRVGLIIQVMASEMARTLMCTGEEASDHLLNLSPYEMKTLLHHILSGKEFIISSAPATEIPDEMRLSVKSKHCKEETNDFARRLSRKELSRQDKVLSQTDIPLVKDSATTTTEEEDEASFDRHGQWLRRRRLDGALNRVPVGFYPRIWEVLRRCPGIRIHNTVLPRSLTQEMTKGEFKFALQTEMVLNTLPHPEYRQLMVEAMMVLTVLVENDAHAISLDNFIQVDSIVREANHIFIEDQKMGKETVEMTMGAGGICQHLYDSAPSGRYGTMTYMCRALTRILHLPVNNGVLDCSVS